MTVVDTCADSLSRSCAIGWCEGSTPCSDRSSSWISAELTPGSTDPAPAAAAAALGLAILETAFASGRAVGLAVGAAVLDCGATGGFAGAEVFAGFAAPALAKFDCALDFT